jgi:hypothetical protein
MTSNNPLPVALAVLAVGGGIAGVAGVSLLATEYAGVWAGVAVAGFAVTIVATAGLYAVGTVGQTQARP